MFGEIHKPKYAERRTWKLHFESAKLKMAIHPPAVPAVAFT